MKYKPKPEIDIEVGAFADIAFLLIIFFVLTTSIQKIMGRDVHVPSSQAAQEQQEDTQLNVVLNGGEILYGTGDEIDPLELDQLRARLIQERFSEREDPKQRMVVVECRDDVDWNRYFKVMTAISRAGGIVAVLESDVSAGVQP